MGWELYEHFTEGTVLEISSEGTRKGKDRDIPNRGDWPAGAQRWEKPGHMLVLVVIWTE